MKWSKSPPELIEAFDAVLPGPPVERRLMFGYPAGFVNGNMVCGLFQDGMVLRLDEADRKKLLQVKGCEPFAPMPGKKSMGGFILVPGSMVADEDAIVPWLERALSYVSKMPSKKKKGAKKKAAAPKKKK
jgi:TfoX/Sxy family transcriptional regulator of competence genes